MPDEILTRALQIVMQLVPIVIEALTGGKSDAETIEQARGAIPGALNTAAEDAQRRERIKNKAKITDAHVSVLKSLLVGATLSQEEKRKISDIYEAIKK